MTTMTAREFNRDVSAAKRAAAHGPVLITDRGEPSFVLLSIQEYHRLGESSASLLDRLSMDDDMDIEFEPLDLQTREAQL